jgi:hypothetical protein
MRLGLPQALRGQVVQAAAGVMDPRTLKPGEPLLLVMGAQGDSLRLVHLEGDVRCVEVDLPATLHGGALQITSGKVSARVQVLGAKAQLVEREGQVGSTLYEAMVDAGGSPQQVLAFADIFQWDVDFLTDIRQEDRFDPIWGTRSPWRAASWRLPSRMAETCCGPAVTRVAGRTASTTPRANPSRSSFSRVP